MAAISASIRRATIFVLLALAAEQVASYRKLEKSYLFPRDVKGTVEYRASTWTAQNLPGVRVFFPGSIAQWANAFNDVPQFTGGSWSLATNQSQQNADAAIVFETRPVDEGRAPFAHLVEGLRRRRHRGGSGQQRGVLEAVHRPGKFDGLPALWSQDGVTIRGVPVRSTSLAHVVPQSAISKHPPKIPEDVAEAARYVAALEDLAAVRNPGMARPRTDAHSCHACAGASDFSARRLSSGLARHRGGPQTRSLQGWPGHNVATSRFFAPAPAKSCSTTAAAGNFGSAASLATPP